jgi:hypothetical protein
VAAEPRAAGVVPGRPEHRDDQREVLRDDEVQRPAHRPRLDQAPVLLQRLPNLVALQPFDARPERELGRGCELRVHAADRADDGEQAPGRHAPIEVVTREPERADLVEGHGRHG